MEQNHKTIAKVYTYTKVLKNKKMCKDKWNGLNSNYKKKLNYRRGVHNLGIDHGGIQQMSFTSPI